MRFVDLADGGRRLAELLTPEVVADAVLLAVPPGGVRVAAPVADALGTDVPHLVVSRLVVSRTDDGVSVEVPVDVTGRRVVVVDDGVETGTAARAVAVAVREAGAAYLVLAVPVCPREVEADLRQRYDVVIAVTRPLVRRSLRWHYETFA
ncbi:MAG TPA: phosphoribosyltransferase family protein [Candidatus Nanopelagicales bacterium]